MSLHVKLVVLDTSPLITLAVARSLNCLPYLVLPVHVPDAVPCQATIKSVALGVDNVAA